MLPPSMTRDWARRLIASEVEADPPCAQTHLATLRVYEKLRRELCAPIGIDSFQALASRALSLAKSHSPGLSTVQITEHGGLLGLGDVPFNMNSEDDGEVGVILIAQLLGLFLALLGEAATLRLIEHIPPPVEVKAKLDETAAIDLATGTSYFGPFESILVEADQLRNVSERLETLVDKYANVEQLMSVAGNIRNIATVLDVFTVVRSKAGGAKDSVLLPPANGLPN
jgi:hypothetical protein